MYKGIIELNNGEIIIEDYNGKKDSIQATKRIYEVLENKNNIEYLEENIKQNNVEIEILQEDIEGSHKAGKLLKGFQIGVTIFAFIGSLVVARVCDFTGSLAVATAIPPTIYGLLAIPNALLKKDISKKEKKIDYCIVSNALLQEDLEKEKSKEKKLPKLVIINPTFSIGQLENKELNEYVDKYRNLAELYSEIETVEAPVKVPVKNRPFFRNN